MFGNSCRPDVSNKQFLCTYPVLESSGGWPWEEDSELVFGHSFWLNSQSDVRNIVEGLDHMIANLEGPTQQAKVTFV